MKNYWLTKYRTIKIARALQAFLDGLTDKEITQQEAEVDVSKFILSRKYESYTPHLAIQWTFCYNEKPGIQKPRLMSALVSINWDYLGF